MSLSKTYKNLLNYAHRIEIVWYNGGLFDKSGYAIQIYVDESWMLLGAKPLVYISRDNALRAARKMRPDLEIN